MKIRHLKTIGLIAGMALLVVLASPSVKTIIAGSIFICIGEAIRIWAAGHLVRNSDLATSGPYAYLRDPLYLGRFFLIIGFCTMAWGYGLLMLPVALGVFFASYMPRKFKKEMARLENIFGEDYRRYSAVVRSLIPRLSPYPQASQKRWRFDVLWSENREQYFLLIVLSVWAALFLRYVGLL